MPSLLRGLSTAILCTLLSSAAVKADGGVLVFGGTGQLGLEIVKALTAKGEDVTVFARPQSDRTSLGSMNISFVTGDVLNEDDVSAAFQSGSFRVVIDALARDGNDDADFYIESMEYISRAAKETGVSQVILHGSVGAGLSHLSERDSEEDFGPLMVAKGLGERYLMESGTPYTIIRNWALLPFPAKESGQAFMTEDQSARGLITRDALARFTVECLNQARCINKIFHTVDDAVDAPERYRSSLKAQRDWEKSQK